jgi:plastocyanin
MKKIFTLFFTLSLAYSLQAQTTHNVSVTSNQYTPSSLTIEQGDIVVWTNNGGNHNVNGTTNTFPSNPEGFGNSVGAGWTYEFTFNTAGEYDYQCDPHVGLGMVGSITVNAASSTPANDDVCDAEEITVDGDAVTVDNTDATIDGDFASCYQNHVDGDVWLTFDFAPTGDINGIEITTTEGSTNDSHIALYTVSGCPDGPIEMTEIACSEDISTGDWMSYISLVLEAGTYYIQCGTYADSQGSYDVEVNAISITESDTCSTFLGGPWVDFNTAFGGAPVATAEGECPFNEITDFQVWASEVYTVDNFLSGETYTFSMCGGDYGAWMPEISIWDEDGNIVAFAQDTCAISWNAMYDGTYLIGINEVGACGADSDNTEVNNGYPALTCEGTLDVEDINTTKFSVFPNPNNGQFNIVNEGQAGEYLIEVMDVAGKVVYAEQVQLNGNAQTEINTSDINTGVYLVKMTNTDENYYRTIRMIVK